MQRVGSAPAKLMKAHFIKYRKEILEALKKTEGRPYVRGNTLSLSKSRIPGELRPSTRAWLNSKAAKVSHKKGSPLIISHANMFNSRGNNQPHHYKSVQTFLNVNLDAPERIRNALTVSSKKRNISTKTGSSKKRNISPKTMKALQRRFEMMK